MNQEERHRYMASREWAILREKVRERSGGYCERCHLIEMAAVHHLTYIRLGREDLEDLQAICGRCHEFLSGKSDLDPRTQMPVVYAHSKEPSGEYWDRVVAPTARAEASATPAITMLAELGDQFAVGDLSNFVEDALQAATESDHECWRVFLRAILERLLDRQESELHKAFHRAQRARPSLDG